MPCCHNTQEPPSSASTTQQGNPATNALQACSQQCAAHFWRTTKADGRVLQNRHPSKVGADVASSTVTATVMDQGRGKKVIVYKYKRKTGYHKKNGHRQAYTEVKIDKINA